MEITNRIGAVMTISAALGNFCIRSIFLGFKVSSYVVLKTR